MDENWNFTVEDGPKDRPPSESPSKAGFGDGFGNGFGDGFGDDALGVDDGEDRGRRGPTTCNNCGNEGHMKRECPDLPEGERGGLTGACYNCGEIGHNKSDCTKPRVFTGTCRLCNEAGHPAKECPTRPPDVCKNCGEEGHLAVDCENDRKVDYSDIPTVQPEDAWKKIEQASLDRDLDDFREAFRMYLKGVPRSTYIELEKGFRNSGFKFYIIALEKETDDTHTIMNLQGKLGQKYVVGFFLSPKCPRKILQKSWPNSPEENLERLQSAGEVVERHVMKCRRCGELGHTLKACQQEAPARRDEIVCTNCEEPGHRMRDCPKPRPDRFACRNCNQRGHNSKECPEPPNPDNVTCKNCEKKGHFARDCPDRPPEVCNNCGETGHRARECEIQKCRNCDAIGHISKECPKPRDYSRVKCNNCGEMGHTRVRCKAPPKEEDVGFGDFGGGEGDAGAFGAGFQIDVPKSSAPVTVGGDSGGW